MRDDEQIRDRLAGNIRAELARQRITASGLAGYLGIAISSATRRLNGEQAFYGYEVALVADFLGVPVGTLYANVTRSGETADPAVRSTMGTEVTP
jgi:hypothetical protein